MAELAPGLRLTMYLHYLCPYGQRTLYAAAFKGIAMDVVEVDLEHKADWHLAMNPAGTSPTLKVTKEGRDYILTESAQIMEYLNSLPGPNLYPLEEDGRISAIHKALIDSHGKIIADQLNPSISPFFSRSPTPEELAKAKAAVTKVNGYIKGGTYIMHSVLHEDRLTMVDLMVLPQLERVCGFRETVFSALFEGEDFTPLLEWFDRMMALPWTSGPRADPKKLTNVYKSMHEGTYHGLSLPLSKYD